MAVTTKFHRNSQYFAWQTVLNIVPFSMTDISQVLTTLMALLMASTALLMTLTTFLMT